MYFPIKNLMESPPGFSPCKCLDYLAMLRFFAKQRDSRILKIISREKLKDCLLGAWRDHPLDVRKHQQLLLVEKLRNLGVTCTFPVPRVLYFTKSSFKFLDGHIDIGLDLKYISKEIVYDAFGIGKHDDRRYDVLAKSTFDSLVARGFPLDLNDVIILDECVEPALKRLRTLINDDM